VTRVICHNDPLPLSVTTAAQINNLFDEYRFFERYPDRELQITGVLFGLLIHHQLLASHALGVALRHVLEALRKPPITTANGAYAEPATPPPSH